MSIGDYGLDPFNVADDADKFTSYRTKELNNGEWEEEEGDIGLCLAGGERRW